MQIIPKQYSEKRNTALQSITLCDNINMKGAVGSERHHRNRLPYAENG